MRKLLILITIPMSIGGVIVQWTYPIRPTGSIIGLGIIILALIIHKCTIKYYDKKEKEQIKQL